MLKRLMQGSTRAALASYLCIAAAGLLFLVQFLVSGWWFAALGVIPLCGAAIILARKIHVAARAGTGSALSRWNGNQGRAANATSSSARSHSKATGRLAAAMDDDPQREERLFEMTSGMGSVASSESGSGSVVLGIARREFRDVLKEAGVNFVALNPSVASTQISELDPQVMLIDAGSFESGPWGGSLDAGGTSLFRVLLDACEFARNDGIDVIVVSSEDHKEHVGTEILRHKATRVIHETTLDSASRRAVQAVSTAG